MKHGTDVPVATALRQQLVSLYCLAFMVVAALFLAVVATACDQSKPVPEITGGSPTPAFVQPTATVTAAGLSGPEEAVKQDLLRRSHSTELVQPGRFRTVHTHPAPAADTVVVVYTYTGRLLTAPLPPKGATPEPTQYVVGAQIVEKDGDKWVAYNSSEWIADPSPSPGTMVCWAGFMGTYRQGFDITFQFGQVGRSDVASVEVDLVSGKTLTDTPESGIFATVDSTWARPATLRFIGANKQVLYTADISRDSPLVQAKLNTRVANSLLCLP